MSAQTYTKAIESEVKRGLLMGHAKSAGRAVLAYAQGSGPAYRSDPVMALNETIKARLAAEIEVLFGEDLALDIIHNPKLDLHTRLYFTALASAKGYSEVALPVFSPRIVRHIAEVHQKYPSEVEEDLKVQLRRFHDGKDERFEALSNKAGQKVAGMLQTKPDTVQEALKDAYLLIQKYREADLAADQITREYDHRHIVVEQQSRVIDVQSLAALQEEHKKRSQPQIFQAATLQNEKRQALRQLQGHWQALSF